MSNRFFNPILCIIVFCFFSLILISCGGGGGSGSTAQPPRILVSSTQIDFGDIVMDNFSEQVYTIKNVGSSTLSIGQIAQADPLALPFSILNNDCSGKGLTANQKCTFKVRFSPAIQGQGLNDSFDVPSNDPNQNPVTVNVSGNAEGIRF